MSNLVLTAGAAGADFRGADNRAIQAAIDAVAQRGGGTVKVLPGTYLLEDSIHLRDNVRLIGSGPETIVRKAPERHSTLTAYLGYGHYDISVAEPDSFQVGMGVTIRDQNAVGFYETIATLTWRDGDRFGIDRMLNHDYAAEGGGEIYTSFAPISAELVSNIEVRDMVVDGNKDENPHVLNNCRGAGVYLLAAKRAVIAGVVVRDLRGDAIGFQQCAHVRIEDCVIEGNTGNGLHPGSGSVGGAIRRCRAAGNGGDGVFFCLRATYCVCDSCEFVANAGRGVSIGGRDGNNAIVGCKIEGNRGAGVFFRRENEVMAPHATLVARNCVADNCIERDDAEILVQGRIRDVHLLDNVIAHHAGPRPVCGVRVAEEVLSARVCDNRYSGEFIANIKVECDPRAVSFSRPQRDLPVGPEAAPPGADRHLPPSVRD
jgi:hypothetical protein